MREDLKRAVEQGQNFSARYRDSISVVMMVRQAVYFLPEAIRIFSETHPEVQIAPVFRYENSVETFLQNEADILFARRDDPLAVKDRISEEDLYGRTLMVGGGSPPALKAVQHRLISSGRVEYFNSADHDTTLTNVAAGKGVCLAPGFLIDHSGSFAWIPFDCKESFPCVLCAHREDRRPDLKAFIDTLKKLYADAVAFPL